MFDKNLSKYVKPETKAYMVVSECMSDIFDSMNITPSKFIEKYWLRYKSYCKKLEESGLKPPDRSISGKIFEIISSILIQHHLGIFIVLRDAVLDGVPLVKPDILVKSQNRYYLLSFKTTLRERWKQADWEALLFKQKHPDAKSFAITLDEGECNKVNEYLKIKNTTYDPPLNNGLDEVVFAIGLRFDQIIDEILNDC
jgi:hypothetical protein